MVHPKNIRFLAFPLFLFFFNLVPAFFVPIFASIKPALLDAVRSQATTFKKGKAAIIESIDYSTRMSDLRVKVPGGWKTTLELGYRMTDINRKSLEPYTSTGSSPSEFQTVLGRLGIGLPFGFAVSLSAAQVFSEHQLTAAGASVSYQVIDASSWIYTDFVPSFVLEANAAKSVRPGLYSLGGSGILGLYHRRWNIQAGYAASYNYSMLMATTPSESLALISHTLVTQFPIYKQLFARAEIGLPVLSGTIYIGYEF